MDRRIVTSVAFLAVIAATSGQEIELSRQTVDGGGGMRATGGLLELSGTIGQPDAGVLAGGNLELSGGFWFSLQPGDCDDDGAVSLTDYAQLAGCLTGPSGSLLGGCTCFDTNRSNRIDLRDFAAAQLHFNAP